MTAYSRRNFLWTGAAMAGTVALASLPRPLVATLGSRPEAVPPIGDPRLKELVLRALEAARAAGATYADVRLTYTRHRRISVGWDGNDRPTRLFWDQVATYNPFDETMSAGVRALVQGYWGFSASPIWSLDELARLGREAVHQAKANALGKQRSVELAPTPIVSNGSWTTPIQIDPFEVNPFEIADYLASLSLYAERTPGVRVRANGYDFSSQDQAFGSSDGSYYTQRIYSSGGAFQFELKLKNGRGGIGELDILGPEAVGWELYRNQPLRDAIDREMERVRRDAELPVKPVDIGRYDAVLDAASMVPIVSQTIGAATELDRAMGYEANAGGTSYITEPLEMVGQLAVGGPLLTVAANRNEPRGLATVGWDDDGVAPEPFTLVKDGVLHDFSTTRESALWLKEHYAKTGTPVRSHGCAAAASAIYAPLTYRPNLVMAPGREALDFEALIAGMSKGLAFQRLATSMDFQQLNGYSIGAAYEIKNGKRVALIASAGILFRALEFWKNLVALGGAGSTRRYAFSTTKGEPPQQSAHSVTAVPAVVKELAVIDPMRKA